MRKFNNGDWIRRDSQDPIAVVTDEPDCRGTILCVKKGEYYLVLESQYELMQSAPTHTSCAEALSNTERLDALEARVTSAVAVSAGRVRRLERLEEWRKS